MILIIGGAYQGKLDFAKEKFGVSHDEVYKCTDKSDIDFSKRCICNIEEFVLFCVNNGKDAIEAFRENGDKWQNSVLICRDIFCGVVPLGADMRAWREMTGRLCAYLSSQAESVYRIFCGLEQKLK